LPRVTVIGTGYLGLTHAVCLADLGHEVLAIDVDEQKLAKAANGEAPFFEPGLEPLLRKNLDAGRLRFTTSFAELGVFGEVHFLVMDLETAELVKVAANAFLATKISFINAMAEVCEQAGADVIPLAEALGYDARIGRRFLSSGLGYGGGCLPKDVRAFRATASALGVGSVVSLLSSVNAINEGRRDRVVALARKAVGGTLEGKRVAVLGVAFKPNSDDIRDSPSLAVCGRLMAEGAIVSAHDPVAMPNAAKKQPGLVYAGSVSVAAEAADLVLHLTEWSDYQAIDPAALARVVARRVIIDARCSLDAGLWHDAGWTVHVLGRP